MTHRTVFKIHLCCSRWQHFIFIVKYYSIVWIYHILSGHTSVDGYTSYFSHFIPLIPFHLGVELLGHMVSWSIQATLSKYRRPMTYSQKKLPSLTSRREKFKIKSAVVSVSGKGLFLVYNGFS